MMTKSNKCDISKAQREVGSWQAGALNDMIRFSQLMTLSCCNNMRSFHSYHIPYCYGSGKLSIMYDRIILLIRCDLE